MILPHSTPDFGSFVIVSLSVFKYARDYYYARMYHQSMDRCICILITLSSDSDASCIYIAVCLYIIITIMCWALSTYHFIMYSTIVILC